MVPALSLVLAAGAPAVLAQPSAAPPPATPAIFGRWLSSDAAKTFSARGSEYRQVDIAPCGKDFCGVSVRPNGACGAVLFRFLMAHAGEGMLTGHGKWGNTRLKLQIESDVIESDPNGALELGLGDNKWEMESRSSSMPKFDTSYKRAGDAVCKAR